ncbi:MAG: hypothetical protein AB7U20_01790 [Planctomycetaceae bacterium]
MPRRCHWTAVRRDRIARRVVSALGVLIVVHSAAIAVSDAQETWFETLPPEVRRSILWRADQESGTLNDWIRSSPDQSGSGIFNTGDTDVVVGPTRSVSHSGAWSVETRIQNALRAKNGNRAARLMIWTDRPWNQGGKHFPQTAYYSTWMYFPHVYSPEKQPPWDPGDGGWWNVFQFKSEDETGRSQPVWSLNVATESAGEMAFYLYSSVNDPHAVQQKHPVSFRNRQWIHVEAHYRSDVDRRGRITIFQDGTRILDADAVTTSFGGVTGRDKHAIWGIGNYTDHIAGDPAGEGSATILFDDSAVSLVPLAPFAKP